MNAITKLDKHYHGLFGFLAVKDSDIWEKSPSPASSLCIKRAVQWMHANNHLYSNFYKQSLANQYERGQVSLCGLFSSTVSEASMTQYCHLQ